MRALLFALVFFLLFFLPVTTVLTFSSGPPSGRTGAPGETTCVTCHSSFALNSGTGNITIGGAGSYTPSTPIQFTFEVAHAGAGRFGFQMAVKDANNNDVGTLSLDDASKTRFAAGSTTHVSHNLAGSAQNQWTVTWTPPTAGVGDVTVYMAGVAADASGTNQGDFVYSTSKVVTGPAAVAPDPPVLSSPNDGATDVATNPTLQWNASDNADDYDVQVATDQNFTNLVFSQNDLAATSVQVTALTRETTYHWRVQANGIGGASGFSASRSFTTLVNAPATAPVLTAPTDGATDVATNPTLTWTAVEAAPKSQAPATAYDLQVATDAGFANLVVDEAGIAQITHDLNNLTNSTTYHWRVRGTNAGGEGPFSNANTFTTIIAAPAVPVLTAPNDAAIDVPTTATLTWNAADRAESYQVQVAEDAGFTNLIIDEASITETTKEITGLAHSTTYHWRVQAQNVGGASGFSDARTFTTVEASPGGVTLDQPADGATDVATTVTLSWQAAGWATKQATMYHVQVATDAGFTNLIADVTGLEATNHEITDLAHSTLHHWRVRASNTGGNGPFSDTRTFTTIIAAPTAPTLDQPSDGTADVGLPPTLSWHAVAGATHYDLQIAEDAGFTNVVADETDLTETNKEITGLANSTTYHWRVRAKNAGGTSAFSTVHTFTTIIALPAIPILTDPADAAADLPGTVTLQWTAANRAATYAVQVATDATFTSLFADLTGLTATNQDITGLSGNTTYHWRVRAQNVAGPSDFSVARSFTTISGVSTEEIGSLPQKLTLAQNYPNPFNPTTQIRFGLAQSGPVRLAVYDVRGGLVVELVNGTRSAGWHTVSWSAGEWPSGLYLYRLETPAGVRIRRLILLK